MKNNNNRLDDILNKNVLSSSCNIKCNHSFIFKCATRNIISFECPICNSISYLYYDKEPVLFELVIIKNLLDEEYLSKKYVDFNYLKKDYVNSNYINKNSLTRVLKIGEDDEDDEDHED